ncbi:hypothetical protein [Rhodovulum sp. PH10]|uniref:hypothetical protein n=1 Tax=Rhodovulum sp. PH10 TaxID=1187851 RepID=UPI00058FD8AE|nr:hypothetical protein [Rhodovulum sp. PH10]
MRDDKPFSDLIDSIGFEPLAELLGLPESHIRTMKARNSIPPVYWGAIIEAAPSLGFPGLSHAQMRGWRQRRFSRTATTERGAA